MKLKSNRLGVLYLLAVAGIMASNLNQLSAASASSFLELPFVEKTIFELGKYFML